MSLFLELLSPADGTLRPLEQVPDPVFSQRMLGDGFAIDPVNGNVFSPCAGTITNSNPNKHALVITQNGYELLIHIGVLAAVLCMQPLPALGLFARLLPRKTPKSPKIRLPRLYTGRRSGTLGKCPLGHKPPPNQNRARYYKANVFALLTQTGCTHARQRYWLS